MESQSLLRSDVYKFHTEYMAKFPASTVSNKMKSDVSMKVINNVIEKIHTNNLTIQKADKGNVLVIESKEDLMHKILTFLSNPIFSELKTALTARFHTEKF